MKPALLLGMLMASIATLAVASSSSEGLPVKGAAPLTAEEEFDRRMAEMDMGNPPGPEEETPVAKYLERASFNRAVALDRAAALGTRWEVARDLYIALDTDLPFDDVSYYAPAARHIRSGMLVSDQCKELLAAAIRRSPNNFERALAPLLAHRTWVECIKKAVDQAVRYGEYKNIDVMLRLRPALAKEILSKAYKYGRVAIIRLVLQRYKQPFYALYEAVRDAHVNNRGSTFEMLVKRCSNAQLMMALHHAQNSGRAYLFGAILCHATEEQIKSYFDLMEKTEGEVDIFVALLDSEHMVKYKQNGKGPHGHLVYGSRMLELCDIRLTEFFMALNPAPAPAPAPAPVPAPAPAPVPAPAPEPAPAPAPEPVPVPSEVAHGQSPVPKRGVIVSKSKKPHSKKTPRVPKSVARVPKSVSVCKDDDDDIMPPLSGASDIPVPSTLVPISGQSGGNPVPNDVEMSEDVVPKENIAPMDDGQQQSGLQEKVTVKRRHGDLEHNYSSMAKRAALIA